MSGTVTITLDREEAENLRFVLHMARGMRRDVGNEKGAEEVAAIQTKLRAALDTPDQPQVPSGPLGDEERERLRGIAERAGEGRLLDDPELIFLRRLADQPPTEERLREKLTEFDAWLSFRGEFSEVLTAFRQSFGTDTSVAALTEKASGDREGEGQ